MVILGIDPGLCATGYGVVEVRGDEFCVMTAGHIRPVTSEPLAVRLSYLKQELIRVIRRYSPEVAVLEKLFAHHKHVMTATLMAHARGVACVAVEESKVALEEYPVKQVKKSLTGNGAATKVQVARMVAYWLKTSDPAWSLDATDALALAITHAHELRMHRNLPLEGLVR
ncbi:MAG: crossover junction endodeoxyribonuclease RuvC [Candidatus Omnitrophica bacterium]|nr:crossover junction endodeoxyribonuclease RuvC [Candidatus Omnitrophota bacterium]MBI2173974.1 crossover junction endodeoxyribonuclease RuvC [Candidatus Omnitrophota bacterium]MBI3009729.1 crossover junction endodeoxyribonuclease RuvC [Candidatus Omnitrophota bacterium]